MRKIIGWLLIVLAFFSILAFLSFFVGASITGNSSYYIYSAGLFILFIVLTVIGIMILLSKRKNDKSK